MPFRLLVSHQTNRSFGGGPGAGLGDLVSEAERDFGPALKSVELEIAHPGQVAATGKDLRKRGMWLPMFGGAGTIPPLTPKASVRFERKRALMRITWVSERVSADEAFMVFGKDMTRDLYDRAVEEVAAALDWGFGKRITASDAFDAADCLDLVQQVGAVQYESDAALRARLEIAAVASRAYYDALGAWEKLDLDWAQFHPEARQILDDPRDWSQGDEFAPHGNDAGADMFADWGRFEDLTCAEAGAAMDLPALREDMPEHLWQEWVHVHLALAFGHIKMSGACPEAIAQATRDIVTQEIARTRDIHGWQFKDDWLDRLRRYDGVLAAIRGGP